MTKADSRNGTRAAALTVRGLSLRFGGLLAVNDVSFTVTPGEIHALIGPNGAGKTTTFNLIAGMYRPDKGEVLLDDRSLVGLRPDQICRAGVGRTFQIVRPFNDLSVIENVAIGALVLLAAQPASAVAAAITESRRLAFMLSPFACPCQVP